MENAGTYAQDIAGIAMKQLMMFQWRHKCLFEN